MLMALRKVKNEDSVDENEMIIVQPQVVGDHRQFVGWSQLGFRFWFICHF